MDAECGSLSSTRILFSYSVWTLVLFSCWFYSLFLFDTLGDAVGFGDAVWVLIVMALMPFCMFATHYIFTTYIVRATQKSASNTRQGLADDANALDNLTISLEMRKTVTGSVAEDKGAGEDNYAVPELPDEYQNEIEVYNALRAV